MPKGIVIRSIRRRLGMSQAVFAQELGVTQGSVSRYENEDDEPSKPVLKHIYSLATPEELDLLISTEADSPVAIAFRGIRQRQQRTLSEFAAFLAISEEDLAAYESGRVVSIDKKALRRILPLASESERPAIVEALEIDEDIGDGWVGEPLLEAGEQTAFAVEAEKIKALNSGCPEELTYLLTLWRHNRDMPGMQLALSDALTYLQVKVVVQKGIGRDDKKVG